MKFDFLTINTPYGKKTVARTAIALIEDAGMAGTKITLNVTDGNGDYIVILTTASQAELVAMLNKI